MMSSNKKELIVASVPGGKHAAYYQGQLGGSLQPIISMFGEFSYKVAEGGDEFIVLYPKGKHKLLSNSQFHPNTMFLPLKHPLDLWVRDFTCTREQIKFCYRPDYLKKREAEDIEKDFLFLLNEELNIHLPQGRQSTLVLDGGNIVENGLDKAVITKRFLHDNPCFSEAQLTSLLEKSLSRKICLLEDFGDTTGHSDGLVAFLDESTILIADYHIPEENNLNENALNSVFGNDLTIVWLPCYEPGSDIEPPTQKDQASRRSKKSKSVDSAMWVYINVLVTDQAVYVPEFLDEPNEEVVRILEENTNKKVLTVKTGPLAHMGGNIRCMTWQLYMDTDIGQALMSHKAIWKQHIDSTRRI